MDHDLLLASRASPDMYSPNLTTGWRSPGGRRPAAGALSCGHGTRVGGGLAPTAPLLASPAATIHQLRPARCRSRFRATTPPSSKAPISTGRAILARATRTRRSTPRVIAFPLSSLSFFLCLMSQVDPALPFTKSHAVDRFALDFGHSPCSAAFTVSTPPLSQAEFRPRRSAI
jgi:hypothetical protein